jgi:beta-galactosidase
MAVRLAPRPFHACIPKILALLLLVLLIGAPGLPAACAVDARQSSSRASEPGRKHTITYDHYSLKIDGRRVYIWGGSFQYYRLPSPGLWKDILQKMKAAGFNAVTIYFDWGYHSPKRGVYDFTGIRDVDRLLDDAQAAGLYVIARPGPYISSEVDGGGFPAWLTTIKGKLQTTDPEYTAAYKQWLTQIDRILGWHQLTNGTGTVILYQIENEFEYKGATPMGRRYMQDIEDKVRADGITVPLTGNNSGAFRDGLGAVDLPGWDFYPQDLHCANPERWNPVRDYTEDHELLTGSPLYYPEFQGGGYGGWGGPPYSDCRKLTGPDFERVFYEANIAFGSTMQSFYMLYGGTSWGWLARPPAYTSYDFGAAINEQRQLTSKYDQLKLLGYFTQAVRPLTKTERMSVHAPSNPALRLDGRVNPDDGTQFYILRHADSTSTVDDKTHLQLDLPGGAIRVPHQPGTAIEVNGRDSKILLANYQFGRQHLVYSTSELMTDLTIGGRDVAVLYGRRGEDGETVLRYPTQPEVRVLSGQVAAHWDPSREDLRLNYRHNGLAKVAIHEGEQKLLLLIGDNQTAESFWKLDTSAGPVLVRGPYLVRTAEIGNYNVAGGSDSRGGSGRVRLTGDTAKATPIEVFAPPAVNAVMWNGQSVDTSRTGDGGLAGRVSGPKPVELPQLTDWRTKVGAPESQAGFDDSGWRLTDRKTTNNPFWNGKLPILNADEYGFHHGDVWYRGRFTATGHEIGVILNASTGTQGIFTAWLNGHWIGSGFLGFRYYHFYFNFDPKYLKAGNANVLSVLVRNMGHNNMNYGRGFKSPRGLTWASLLGSSAPITWRIQGNRGGETPIDLVRGPFNNGGLYGERMGWSLPGYPDRDWQSVTLPDHLSQPGVTWYRTTFRLHIPADQDVPIGLKISDRASRRYRALIFINGWQLGRYINDLGPQHVFVLPPGILQPDGENTIAIASWSTERDGGLGEVSLVKFGNYLTSLRVEPVSAPEYNVKTYGHSLP